MTDGPIICDHLDVTHSPDDTPFAEVGLFLLSLGALVVDDGLYQLGEGKVKLDRKPSHTRVSASGAALAHLRHAGEVVWFEYLSLLGSRPHRVTRLDAALDVLCSEPADVVHRLKRRYLSGCRLGRKALPTTTIFECRNDGRESGTWYAGRLTRARCTARVYDKSWERLKVAGVVMPPTVRYEVTVRRDYGATLRDAAQPRRLFWHVASPALLRAPAGVEPWESGWGGAWEFDMVELLPAEVLRRKVETSSEIGALADLADQMGPHGRVLLARQLLQRLGVHAQGSLSRSSQGLSEVSTG